MGGLCEKCDSYGEIWGDPYGSSDGKTCQKCDIFWTYFYMVLQCILVSVLTVFMTY